MKMQRIGFLAIVLTFLLFTTFLGEPVYAADGGVEFSDWYSTSYKIKYYPGNSTRYYKVRTNNYFSPSDFNSLASYAASAWSGVISLQRLPERDDEDGEEESYEIFVSEISRQNVGSNVPWGAIGYADAPGVLVRTTTSSKGDCFVYQLQYSSMYLIYDSEVANYPFNKLRCAMTHEMGHAIGYDGHDDRVEALMYSTDANYDSYGIYTPQSRDLTHLHNVYPYRTN